MNVRCPKCNRWLLEMTSPGTAVLRINCNGCKERWTVFLEEKGVKVEISQTEVVKVEGAKKIAPAVNIHSFGLENRI